MNGRAARGFTLIELIIGLTLISMALTIAFASLRLATRSMERTSYLVEELEELRIVRSVVQTQLVQALPLREASTEQQVNFQGGDQQLEFVAPAPVQSERLAGLYRYRLALIAQEAGRSLVLDYEPYQPGVPRAWPAEHETATLMDNITEGEFSYFGALPDDKDNKEAWQSQWSGMERLPRMVRIILQRSQPTQQVVELVVALPTERVR